MQWKGAASLLVITSLGACARHSKPDFFVQLLDRASSRASVSVTSLPAPSVRRGEMTGADRGTALSPKAPDPAVQSASEIIADRSGNEPFSFQTSRRVGADITVTDPGGSVSGAVITLTDPGMADRVLFQGLTDGTGRVVGQVAFAATGTELGLSIVVGDHVAHQIVQVAHTLSIVRAVHFNRVVNAVQRADEDGDGIPDDLDAYPHDASRSTRLEEPTAVVTYEDLYPETGDGDFNDLTVQVRNEQDLDRSGRIVRLRGHYRVLARGGGYSHNLLLNLPGRGSVHFVVRDGSGNVKTDLTSTFASLKNLPVFPKDTVHFGDLQPGSDALFDSSVLCPGMCNVVEGGTIVPGYQADMEVTFAEPFSAGPGRDTHDLFLYVKNTGREIHFPGLYSAQNGSDRYLSANGTPWALSVPVEWNWPLEQGSLEKGYPRFHSWLASKGETNRDWYQQTTPESERGLFRFFSRSPIAAYFLQFGLTHRSLLWAFMAVMLTGLIVLLFLKGRSDFEA